ncbi:MAG TPA: MlaD family protein [Gemmatimonadaceae bacterium]|jgi:phospholipid/cholesterol/gamma-HCH transport system substrate-binding protein|nr:MlaD family protein [Gemmatimonadaceae bacterium]
MKRPTMVSWAELKVGVVILIAIAIMIITMFKLGEAANLFTHRYDLIAYVKDGKGLTKGGSVTVDGQVVGDIKSIEFLPVSNDTTRSLKITLEVDRRLQAQIRGDSRAAIQTLGLLGDKVLNISSGSAKYNALQPGDVVPLASALDYDEVIAQAGTAVTEFVGLTRDLRAITGDIVRGDGTMGQLVTNRSLYDQLTATLKQTNDLMARLQNPSGTVGKLIDDPALYENLVTAVASLDSLTVRLNSDRSSMGKLLRDDSLYSHIVGLTVGADSLVHNLAGGKGFAGKMLRDDQLYDQLLKAVTDLNVILDNIRQDPKRYTRGMVKVF